VARILVQEGAVVAVGTVLVVIGVDADAPAAADPVAAEGGTAVSAPAVPPSQRSGHARAGQVRATPLVRRLAHEHGVDLVSVVGTGPGGRVTERDVRAAAVSPSQRSGHVPNSAARTTEGRREKVRGVRRQIVEHLARAHREVPAVTFVEECDFTGVDVAGLVPLALKACAAALAEYPELNARLERDEIVYLDRYDLGVAVQTEQGLVVPVVRGCDSASLAWLATEVGRLAGGARAGTLKPEELRGGTFTLTSAGKLGGVFVTPLVNHPEVAILGLHRIAPRPVVRDGEVVVRSIGNVSTTFDHRVVDGARAAAFTLDVIARLERGA
jgi:pyruvate dehydrogenase E2 component (dihydrolipoamide acetyltransferase)